MKKSIYTVLFSLAFVLQIKSQAVITNTSIPQPTAIISPCYNMGFESTAVGSYSALAGWTFGQSTYTNNMFNGYCLDYPTTNTTTVYANISNTPYVDAALTPSVLPPSPFFGNNWFEFTSNPFAMAFVTAERTFSVTATNKIFECAYMYLVSHSHSGCCDAAYMKFKLLDNVGNAIPCGSVAINGSTGGSTACINPVSTSTNFQYVWSPNWIINTYDLSPYLGTNVTIKLECGSCTAGAHPSRIWYDAKCMESIIRSNGVVSGSTITVCNSANIATLTSNAVNSCTWNGPPTSSIVNINSSSISTSVSGVYSLSIFNPNCASTTTFTYLVNFCNITTSINEKNNTNEILIYPNPSSEKINIKGNKEIELRLIDFSGREIERFTLTNSNGYRKDISGLSHGVYFILGNAIQKKIIVQSD